MFEIKNRSYIASFRVGLPYNIPVRSLTWLCVFATLLCSLWSAFQRTAESCGRTFCCNITNWTVLNLSCRKTPLPNIHSYQNPIFAEGKFLSMNVTPCYRFTENSAASSKSKYLLLKNLLVKSNIESIEK